MLKVEILDEDLSETKNENTTPWIATHPGTILKYELEDRGISQKEFAEMIGMQKSHVCELIKGKRTLTKTIASKVEEALGISAISLVNMQAKYEYDMTVIGQKSVKEQKALNALKLYDEVFDVRILLKRLSVLDKSAVDKLKYLVEVCKLPKPAELQLECAGKFKKSAKTGQDVRMLMTWKILAETKAKSLSVKGVFARKQEQALIEELIKALHENQNTECVIKSILSKYGIAFCIEEKIDKASVDGYSYFENGKPYIILTKRYDRIDSFAFALMHEIGHIYRHYTDKSKQNCKLSISEYDNESSEEREANEYAANALIPNNEWKNAPQVRINSTMIQKTYTTWAEERGMNKWIVLGRIAYETGMFKFKTDDSRRVK